MTKQSRKNEDIIRGDVLLFGMGESIRGLSQFEIGIIKDNITLEKTNQVNHLMLSGVTCEPRSLPDEGFTLCL